MKTLKVITLVCISLLIGLLAFRQCKPTSVATNVVTNAVVVNDSEAVAVTSYVTQAYADSIIAENNHLQSLVLQASAKGKIVYRDRIVPYIKAYIDTIYVDSNKVLCLALPAHVSYKEPYLSIDGVVTDTGLVIDSLTVITQPVITVGESKLSLGEKLRGVKPLMLVTYEDKNPNLKPLNVTLIQPERKHKKWYETRAFAFVVGAGLGFALK